MSTAAAAMLSGNMLRKTDRRAPSAETAGCPGSVAGVSCTYMLSSAQAAVRCMQSMLPTAGRPVQTLLAVLDLLLAERKRRRGSMIARDLLLQCCPGGGGGGGD